MTTQRSDLGLWYRGPLLAFDTESTGPAPETDRIVTAALVWIDPGQPVTTKHHLINPGVPIPEEAAAIHGITTERVRVEGREPKPSLDEIAHDLVGALSEGRPIVGMNCVFDLTILDRELRRHELATLEDRLGRPIAPVIDALVLDRYVVPRRRGRGARKLVALCEAWRVRMDGAHDACNDALAAARVVWQIARRVPEIGRMPLPQLHGLQARAHAEHCAELRAYFDRHGRAHDGVPGDWPLIPYRPEPTGVVNP